MPQIALKASEVSQFVSLRDWPLITYPQRRQIAAAILRQRSATSPAQRDAFNRAAFLCETANPNYNDFAIIQNQ